ncbi:serine threonine-kinase [Micractinium conductrix]|uniref:Serine threonine-kinase n=1 Tax=Micractinium conductrix TaxID=554055 RepID=A0A2P6VGM6_9CHLO|nr:serine threonine-kinase [Micractinium conductrix]|eukprot:PSC73227.1 serine threonine-kinase [Micractinium conductrix]
MDACDECRFYSLGCTLAPVVANSSRQAVAGSPTPTAGFPVRYELNDLPGFTAQAGQGVPGADITCPQSLLPGKCAVNDTTDVVVLCIRTPECAAVVHYFRGLDGCSQPVSLLVHDSLTQSGAFVSPTVATLSRIDTGSLRETTLMASDNATVVLPPVEQLPADATEISNTTWLGCIITPNALMAGDVVEVVSGVATAEECCKRCRGDMRCNLFNYCKQPGGCTFSWGPRTLSLEQAQCELRFNEPVSLAEGGFPPAVIDKGPAVPFVGGAPLAVLAPPLPGFIVLPGRNQFQFSDGSFNCSFTINPQSQECVVQGTPEELGDTCQQTPECVGLILLEQPEGAPIGVLKAVIDKSSIGLSPTNALYIRNDTRSGDGGGGGGGLSTGAVVGVARSGGASVTGAGSGPAAAPSSAASSQPLASFELASTLGSRTRASPFAAARARAAALGHAPAAGGGALGGSAAITPTMSPTISRMSEVSARSGLASGPSSSGTSASNVLPELVAHVANQDAGAQQSMGWVGGGSSGGGGGDDATAGGELLREVSLLSPQALSAGLRDWLVDLQEVEFLRWPNGALQELGQGASATVYKVLYRGEEVAAKEVEIGRSAAMQELFVKEAERLHQMRHAHVVGLYGVVLSGSQGLLLMEYCSGRDLHSALQLKAAGSDQRLFGWYGRGRRVAADIAKGLNFLHSKGCVHMDIKSSNVLLTGSGTAKLADVGLARLQQNTHISGMETKAVGTFSWMAPEVIMGSRCTSSVDLFSFGVVLWEIITGEQPLRGEMRLPHVPDECPREAADLITRCMSLDAGQRPTAQQLMRELEAMKGRH